MRPRQSSLGIGRCRCNEDGCQGFNEAEAIKPRNLENPQLVNEVAFRLQ